MANVTCGVYMGEDLLNVVVLRHHRKGLQLLGTACRELSGDETDSPGEALKQTLKGIKKAPGSAVLVLPKDKVGLNVAVLPSTDPGELKPMARFEAMKTIHFNAERHSVGHRVLRNLGSGTSEVLLATADEPVVERSVTAAEVAGISVDGLNLSSPSLVNAVLHESPEIASKATYGIIAIGLDQLELVFVTEGRLIFSRSIPQGIRGLVKDVGGSAAEQSGLIDNPHHVANVARTIDMLSLEDDLSSADADETKIIGLNATGRVGSGDAARLWMDRLSQQIRRSYDYARREMALPDVEHLFLTGEGAGLPNLDKALYSNLAVPISILNPFSSFSPESTESMPFGGLEAVSAFGAALETVNPDAYSIDLMPESYYKAADKKALIGQSIVTGVLFAIAAGLAVYTFMDYRASQAALASRFQSANKKMEPIARQLNEERDQLSVLTSFMRDPANALEVLNLIGNYPRAPREVSIKSIEYVKGERVIIDGHGKSPPDVNAFTEYLTRSGLFDEVLINRQDLRGALSRRPEVYVFQIEATVPLHTIRPTYEKITAREIRDILRGETQSLETEFVAPRGSRANPPSNGGSGTESSAAAGVLGAVGRPSQTETSTQPNVPGRSLPSSFGRGLSLPSGVEPNRTETLR